MLDFNTLADFSRGHCIGICAFLVPVNLIAAFVTIILTFLRRPIHQVWPSLGVSSILAVVMLLHVYTWFAVGVVMYPSYILLSLAICCLLANFVCIIWHKRYIDASSIYH